MNDSRFEDMNIKNDFLGDNCGEEEKNEEKPWVWEKITKREREEKSFLECCIVFNFKNWYNYCHDKYFLNVAYLGDLP